MSSCDQPNEPEDLINIAIDEAEEVSDPVEGLIEKTARDPGVAFETENVAILSELKAHDPAKFQRMRVRLLKNKVRIVDLEKLLSRRNYPEQVALNGAPLEFERIEKWPEIVDGEKLHDEIIALLLRHMVLPRYAAEALALWIMFSHTHECWSISPRLAIVSPEKRCGKTTALSILQQLVPKSLPASNITAAALFRAIHHAAPTLIIDEADTFLRGNDELRGILNSGHNRNYAYVVRAVGDDHVPAKFSTWAPVAIAMIGALPDTLNDRSIVISLKRKLRDNQVERLRLDNGARFLALRQKIYRWAADNCHHLPTWDGSVPEALHDRAADNWRPLLAIADAIGGKYPSLARDAAVALTGMDDEGSISVLVLKDLREIFMAKRENRLPTEHILQYLSGIEGRPWPEYRNGKPITSTQLAKLLKPFGIHPKTKRFVNNDTAKGYSMEDFDDAFARYLPISAVTPSQASIINDYHGDIAVTTKIHPTADVKQKSSENYTRDGVTAQIEVDQGNEPQRASYRRIGYRKLAI